MTMTVTFDEDKRNKRYEELRKSEEEELMRTLSEKYGMGYIDLGPVSISPDSLKIIPEAEARAAHLAPFAILEKKVKIGIHAPNDPATDEALRKLADEGYEITLYLISQASLDKAWGRYKDLSFAQETKAGSLNIANDAIDTLLAEVRSMNDIRKRITDTLALKRTFRISRILEIMMAGAISTSASDIHIEPEETTVHLRYRLDGVLVPIIEFDNETYELLLSRVKLLSGLKLNIKNNAQDGRFSVIVQKTEMEIRTSTLPGAYGESIVMRILNPETIAVKLEQLGIEPHLYDILQHEIDRPNGMILTTGPTGSGKTTTLYAFMRKIKTPEVKIITIEDPIEYHLDGIVQTQTNSEKGYSFASGLRAILRQDPDIIMVGEIRDGETADIAINSALTGHLVFSTLHTNNAAGTYPRLIDLGINPKIICSALTIALAQRLVRRLCPFCRKEVKLEGKDLDTVTKLMLSISVPEYRVPATTMFLPVGCEKCNQGYKGRIGVYEAIITDSAVEEVVRENPSEREIRIAAAPQGLLDMRQDGIIKVVKGITTLEELTRVVDLEAV